MFLEPIVSYNWKTDYFLNHLWYICKIKVCDLCATYYFKTMKLLQLFWKYKIYYNFWKHILHLILYRSIVWYNLLRLRLLIELSTHPLFPLQFQIVKNSKFWEFWYCVVSRKRSLVILGLDSLLIVLYLLVNWHYIHKVWILFLLNYWRPIHKEIVEVF